MTHDLGTKRCEKPSRRPSAEDAPIEWAVTADGVLYTAQIPIREDGSIETGPIDAQADLTLLQPEAHGRGRRRHLADVDAGAGLPDRQGARSRE